MLRTLITVVLAIACLNQVPARAEEPAQPGRNLVIVRRCEIEYKRSSLVGVAHMGSTGTTVLQDCLVRLGDHVKAGQVLGRVMDRDVQAEFELRKAEAGNEIAVMVSEAKYAQALAKLKRSESLQKRVYVSTEELNEHQLEANTAKLEIELSKYRRRLAEIEARQAETMLQARQYISPHDGVVVEIHKEQGEAVSSADPIFRVVEVDWLKVSGYLNLSDYWRVRPGQEVRITPEIDGEELPVEREVFTGRIVFVDRRIDPANRTCKVVAEVANRDLLLASGLEARMEILLDSPSGGEPTAEPAKSAPKRNQTPPVSRLETSGRMSTLSP
jgi:RND family efflux transporter MFP subunit